MPDLFDRELAEAQGPLRRADDVSLVEPIDELLLTLRRARVQRHLGCRPLCQHFPELPQLDQRDSRVPGEVLLGLRRESDEPRIVVREVSEVRGWSDNATAYTRLA